jgi:hypothetical protein
VRINLDTGYLLFDDGTMGLVTVLVDIEGEVTTVIHHAVTAVARVPSGGWITVRISEFTGAFH